MTIAQDVMERQTEPVFYAPKLKQNSSTKVNASIGAQKRHHSMIHIKWYSTAAMLMERDAERHALRVLFQIGF
jgi:hypothetical protein